MALTKTYWEWKKLQDSLGQAFSKSELNEVLGLIHEVRHKGFDVEAILSGFPMR